MITVNELLDVIGTEGVDRESPVEICRLAADDDGPLSPLEVAGVSITEELRLRIEVI